MEAKNERLGALIAALRERSRLTQADLARRVGVSQSHISRIESGSRTVCRERLRLIAGILKISPAELLRQAAGRKNGG